MAKPSITTRTGKGSPLNYSELDTNFTNLRDATITVTDGTNSTDIDLNGTIQFTAGSNMTVTESGGVITLASSGGFEPDPVSGDYEFDGSDLDLNGGTIKNNSGNIAVSDDINFPSGAGPAVLITGGNLLLRGGVDVSSTENDGTITLQANTIQFNTDTVSGLPGLGSLPISGDNTNLLYEHPSNTNSIVLRDDSTQTAPKAFLELDGGTTGATKLQSESYLFLDCTDSGESYNVWLNGEPEHVTRIDSGGLKLPVVTTTQRDATNITTLTGTVVFNSTTGNFEGYNGTSWVTLG